MNATPVVTNAVDELNRQRNEQVLTESVRLVNAIANEQAKVVECEKQIEQARVDLNAIANRVVTAISVMGNPLPANANTETIAAVIAKANKEKQYSIEQQSGALTQRIVSEQDAIVLINKRIAELREALVKLTVPKVTAEQIVG